MRAARGRRRTTPTARSAAGAHVRSFPPVVGRAPEVLVLGSMPSTASLRAGRYYAHPRNAFWRIMGELLGAGPERDYEERLARLRTAGVALWDVLASCTREGSLDAGIDESTVVPNDIAGLLRRHPRIELVCCNGAKSEASFRRHVAPELERERIAVPWVRLPSTSPANAAVPYVDKLAAWRDALRPVL